LIWEFNEVKYVQILEKYLKEYLYAIFHYIFSYEAT